MRAFIIGFLMWLASAANIAAQKADPQVLIVMDEREQMEALAKFLKGNGVESTIVDQRSAPADWSTFDAVIAYIHGTLQEPIELKIIEYTKAGGRYVCLHHSVSSGKAKNKYYFDFLGVRLPGAAESKNPAPPGGHYAWRHDQDYTIVNIAPGHFITGNGMKYRETLVFPRPGSPGRTAALPSFLNKQGEPYMNVELTGDKVLLLGFHYVDDRNGAEFHQHTAGWLQQAGRGWIVYLQPGHATHEFENPNIAQLVLNAVLWKPGQ